jgi:hypothetical protein
LKELETVKAAQKLLGAPTIGGVSAWSGGCWWRELKVANQPEEITKNRAKNGQFPTLSVLKLLKTPFFSQKYLIRYSRLPRYFLRNTLTLNLTAVGRSAHTFFKGL